MSEKDLAPDFKIDSVTGARYPGGGERIGPAWQWAWERMADRKWHRGGDLAYAVESPGALAPATIKNLLRLAAQFGHLEVKIVREPARTGVRKLSVPNAYYRRKR